MEKIVLLDTSVIIQMYRGDQEILKELKRIGNKNLAICSIVARNKRELSTIRKDIESLHMIFSDENSEKLALELMGEYSLSHGQALPDCLDSGSFYYQ